MKNKVYKFEELQTTGLLWLINRVVFHPRGYALAVVKDENKVLGFELLGTGEEIFVFDENTDDEKFAMVKKLLP